MDTRTKTQRSRIMASVPSRNSRPEMAVRSILHKAGYRFLLHDHSLPGTPDIVFRKRRKVVFVHGCFWHGHECAKGRLPKSRRTFWSAKVRRNRKRDSQVIAALTRDGWQSILVWQCELKDHRLLRRLQCFLGAQRLGD